MKNSFTKFLGASSLLSIVLLLLAVFYWTPEEVSMGIVQKIMYVHVPSIWITFLAFFIVFFCSIGYLWKRQEVYDVIAGAAAEIGVLFCAMGILTGAIWGRPTWNTYWTWDARLTTTLILFLIFVGYLLVRSFLPYGSKRNVFSAILGIIGFLDVPLIHQSVVWWRTLHQPSTMFSMKENTIDQPLANMLWLSLGVFSIIFLYFLLQRIQLEKSKRNYFLQLIQFK